MKREGIQGTATLAIGEEERQCPVRSKVHQYSRFLICPLSLKNIIALGLHSMICPQRADNLNKHLNFI